MRVAGRALSIILLSGLTPGVASADSVNIAQPLYRAGAADRGVAACSACHGPTGAGNPAAAYPRISGQNAAYTALQLKAYRAGERGKEGAGQMMAGVAKQLTDAINVCHPASHP